MPSVDLTKLHAALAGLVRAQAEAAAGSDNTISTPEKKKLVESPIKDVIDSMPKKALTVDKVVSEVMARKKALLAAAKVDGATIGIDTLLKLKSKDAPLAALLWRAMFTLTTPEKEFSELPHTERAEILASGETDVKNAQWQELEGPAKDKVVAKYKEKLTQAARSALPDNDDDRGPGIVRIGVPEIRVSVLRALDGTILGASAKAIQKGGCYRDEVDGSTRPDDEDRRYSFDTPAEAEQAGVDTRADVSWVCGPFAFDASATRLNDGRGQYWEWTGW